MKFDIKYEHLAHFRASHDITYRENEMLFVLHGYGQLSEFFLKKLSPLFSEERLIVAPEATNYHYLQGFSGRVGANWMTKHERESAISNNNNYLNAILELLLSNYKSFPILKVLGFSQGAATATRWVSQLKVPIETLILWGGGFAHDLEPEKASLKLKKTNCFIATGDRDEFITEESMSKQDELIKAMRLKVERVVYPGGHDLDLGVLSHLIERQKVNG
ncbi:alpha/beta hydrolase [Shivajiella indica]|uniref:Alpha/beta hydrolase n=1 Tax=Shivajiella indica TaxID=872115 RepID=A0ABW5B8E4_9BACT